MPILNAVLLLVIVLCLMRITNPGKPDNHF
jgi:hypothetical protein